MFFQFYLICLVVYTIQCQSAFEDEANSNLCNFFDTINITGGIQNPDDSITFNVTRFTKENYATFTYTYLPNQVKKTVPAHKRGCICKYQNCVRLCCPLRYSFNQIQTDNEWQCVLNNNVTEIDLSHLTNISVVSQMPCKVGNIWIPPKKHFDDWKVLSNGSLMLERYLEPFIVDRDEYCLALVTDDGTNKFSTKVMLCPSNKPDAPIARSIVKLIHPAAMIVTVVFLSTTLFIYFWIEDLRTLHGKIFMCYLASWIIGYIVLAFGQITSWQAYKKPIACLILAELKHTTFIAGFVWLCIIGYDIWRAVGRADHGSNQFLKYCALGYGTTFLIVLITNILDHVPLLNKRLRPGLGTSGCWLQKSGQAYVIYLYVPVIIIIIINTVFFLLTKRKIDKAQKLANYATNNEDSKKFSNNETDADRLHLFLRLAIIMGLPWLVQIVAWLLSIYTYIGTIIFIITNVVIKLVGPLIFFLCIKKPRVKRLIQKKWSILRPNGIWGSSAATQTTTVPVGSGS